MAKQPETVAAMLTVAEREALSAARVAIYDALGLETVAFEPGSVARVAAAFSGLAQGIEDGIHGTITDRRRQELMTIQNAAFAEGVRAALCEREAS